MHSWQRLPQGGYFKDPKEYWWAVGVAVLETGVGGVSKQLCGVYLCARLNHHRVFLVLL